MIKKIAVIAAHPDDEALGCSGTLFKYKEHDCQIAFLWMTNGIDGRSKIIDLDRETRRIEIQKAIDFIKPDYTELLDFPDNKMDQVPLLDIVKKIEKFLVQTKPDLIYTHFINDLNIDHALTCRAAITAARPGGKTFVKEIYSFEVPSSTEWAIGKERFIPDTYVDITSVIDKKKKYLECYNTEMRNYPHPRSIDNILALNQVRGSHICVDHAEAYVTVRRIVDAY